MNAQYFTAADYHPTALLRRTKDADEAFVDGAWRPTSAIVDYNAGNDDFVDEVTEERARMFAPAAFA